MTDTNLLKRPPNKEAHIPSSEMLHALKAVYKAVARPGDDRPHMIAVQFTVYNNGGLALRATDGRWAARWTNNPTLLHEVGSVVATTDSVLRVIKILRASAAMTVLAFDDNDRWSVTCGTQSESLMPIDDGHLYPNIDRVIDGCPRYDKHASGAAMFRLGARYLGLVESAFRCVAGREATLQFEGAYASGFEPFLITCPTAPELTAVLMPITL